MQTGDLVSLIIGPRDGNHSCDLTDIELVLKSAGEGGREWSLTQDVSPNVLAGNPHADRFGNDGIWHFYTEAVSGRETGPVIPAGSLLAKWQSAENAEEKLKLAQAMQTLLTSAAPAAKDSPDAKLYQQLASLSGPLFAKTRSARSSRREEAHSKERNSQSLLTSAATNTVGLDPARFGKHPNGSAIDAEQLVRASAVGDRDPSARRPRRGCRVCDDGHSGSEIRCRGQCSIAGRSPANPPTPTCCCRALPPSRITRELGPTRTSRSSTARRSSSWRAVRPANESRATSTSFAAGSPPPSATPRSCRSTKSSRSPCSIAKTIISRG